MTYKQKDTDVFCYDDYCIDTQMKIIIDKQIQDVIEFDVPVNGSIREDYNLMINNKTVSCDSYNNSNLKCRFNVSDLDEDKEIYELYSKQCGIYYKTGIQIITSLDCNISINYIILTVFIFLILV